jgi:hypothetical protein
LVPGDKGQGHQPCRHPWPGSRRDPPRTTDGQRLGTRRCRYRIACYERPRAQDTAAPEPPISKASLCQGLRRCSSRSVKCPSGAVVLAVILDPWPSSRPGVAVVLRRLQVVRPRCAAGAPPGPAAAPAAGWQRPGNGQPCRGHGRAGRRVAGRSRRVVTGPGVACPKSRCLGCNPAALATESFPGCPPGPLARAAARWASACRQARMALLTCRFSERGASLPVLPSASFLS